MHNAVDASKARILGGLGQISLLTLEGPMTDWDKFPSADLPVNCICVCNELLCC